MRFIDAYRISKANMFRSKSRSFLTIIGVAVGVGAIVMLVSLGIGLQKLTVEQIATLDILTTLNVTVAENSTQEMKTEITDEFEKIKNVESASPSLKLPAQFTYEETTTSTITQGVREKNLEIEQVDLIEGNLFSDGKPEIILSKSLLTTLGEEEAINALGKKIQLKLFAVSLPEEIEDPSSAAKEIDEEVTIVGVDRSETVGVAYVPLDFLQEKTGIERVDLVKVKAKNRKSIDGIREEIRNMGFEVSTISDLIRQVDTVFLVFEIVLGSIGGIGLFVAAIGVINTMTIALLERTHEIGIMKAIGATNKDVRRLFVNEAILIAFVGGFLGLILGYAFGGFLDLVLNLLIKASGGTETMNLFITPPLFAFFMLAFTIFMGWITGLYPARRAAKLSPLEALHVE